MKVAAPNTAPRHTVPALWHSTVDAPTLISTVEQMSLDVRSPEAVIAPDPARDPSRALALALDLDHALALARGSEANSRIPSALDPLASALVLLVPLLAA